MYSEMSATTYQPSLVDPLLLGSWIAKHQHIWQMDFLNGEELAKYADDRGISSSADYVRHLWQLGLLRADVVAYNPKTSYAPLPSTLTRAAGFYFLGRGNDGSYLYADARVWQPWTKSWHRQINKLPSLPANIQPLFHPFRYYVLYHLDRALSLMSASFRKLHSLKGYHQLVDLLFPSISNWSTSPETAQVLKKWNHTVALAVLTEPCLYERVIGVIRGPIQLPEETLYKQIAAHWKCVETSYQRFLTIDRLKAIHQDLCVATQMLDRNRAVHTLLCLGQGEERLHLEGRLGGALLLRTMAEMIRRAAEEVYATKIPEEDERGFGWMSEGTKKTVYGFDRLFDGAWEAKDEFARQFGLRFGHHVRWYVEGNTELYALTYIFNKLGARDITIINLHGQVAEGARKGVAFRESLRADIDARRYSLVSIDGDRSDFARAVDKAIQDDQICGGVYISRPDFELANFSRFELEAIVWQLAQDHGATKEEFSKFGEMVQSWRGINDLLERARRVLSGQAQVLGKGERWGQYLIEYAWQQPKWTGRENHEEETERQIIRAILTAIRASQTNYTVSRRDYRVNKEGMLVPRLNSPVAKPEAASTD